MAVRNSYSKVVLIVGEKGCGKTTTAKDFAGSIDTPFTVIELPDGVSELQNTIKAIAMGTSEEVFCFEDFQYYSVQMQNGMLKFLEELPRNLYVMLSTTPSGRILPTIRTRCTVQNIKPNSIKDLQNVNNDLEYKLNEEQLMLCDSYGDLLALSEMRKNEELDEFISFLQKVVQEFSNTSISNSIKIVDHFISYESRDRCILALKILIKLYCQSGYTDIIIDFNLALSDLLHTGLDTRRVLTNNILKARLIC